MLHLIKSLRPLLTADDRRQWVILLCLSLAAGIARSLFLALINAAIAAGADASQSLALYAAGALALAAVVLGADYFVATRGCWVFAGMATRMRNRLLDQIGSANLQFVERETAASLHFHLIHTIRVISDFYGTLLLFCNALVTLGFNLIYIGWLSPVGLAVAAVITLVGVTTHWHFERKNFACRERLNRLANIHNNCHHAYLNGYKELRLSRAKMADYRNQLDEINRQVLMESVTEARVSNAGKAATNLFEYLAIAAIALLLPALVHAQPVQLMQLLSAVLFTIGPLGNVVGAFPSFATARISMDHLQQLTREVEATRETLGTRDRASLPPFEMVTLRDVSFEFAKREAEERLGETFQLGPVNLTIRRGEVVCVVGGNGSGKTVLMRLLSGLYRPTSGQIVYNGIALGDGDRQAYREQITTVFSDFFLFKELLGRRDTAAAKVMAWIEHFGLSRKTGFLEKEGMFSTVELSTGQRKRMALIVSILDERPIIVLDEFGAEQDPAHRHQFYRSWLPELKRMGKTVVVVSHDDHYFDAADRVVRMDFGRVIEDREIAPRAALPLSVVNPA
jgi:putative pyoverdin transport system ATP-binding/permease protein